MHSEYIGRKNTVDTYIHIVLCFPRVLLFCSSVSPDSDVERSERSLERSGMVGGATRCDPING